MILRINRPPSFLASRVELFAGTPKCIQKQNKIKNTNTPSWPYKLKVGERRKRKFNLHSNHQDFRKQGNPHH